VVAVLARAARTDAARDHARVDRSAAAPVADHALREASMMIPFPSPAERLRFLLEASLAKVYAAKQWVPRPEPVTALVRYTALEQLRQAMDARFPNVQAFTALTLDDLDDLERTVLATIRTLRRDVVVRGQTSEL
jgi:hypothetical protein